MVSADTLTSQVTCAQHTCPHQLAHSRWRGQKMRKGLPGWSSDVIWERSPHNAKFLYIGFFHFLISSSPFYLRWNPSQIFLEFDELCACAFGCLYAQIFVCFRILFLINTDEYLTYVVTKFSTSQTSSPALQLGVLLIIFIHHTMVEKNRINRIT